MRDIEFRGKCSERYEELSYKECSCGDWVFGSLVHQTDFYGIPVDRYYIIDGTDTQDYDIGPAYRVDKETIGQYVGRKDKNGKKIYEGDILVGKDCYSCWEGINNYYGEVRRFDEVCQFGIWVYKKPGSDAVGMFTGNIVDLDDWNSESWEVIGNVYDNPELTFGGDNE